MKSIAYIQTPIKTRAKVNSKLTRDSEIEATKGIASWRLLREVYRRNDRDVWVFVAALQFAALIWLELGR